MAFRLLPVWRTPFIIGFLIVPFLFVLRRSLQETETFRARRHHPSTAMVYASMLPSWRIVLAGSIHVAMTTVSFYLITVYIPTFGKSVVHQPRKRGSS